MRNNLSNIQWCPGCGDFLILAAIKKAFKDLGIESHQRTIVSGIGCSGKISQYIDGYNAETLHGRAIPFATGVKISRPDMHVLVVTGDGDGYGIGMSHLIHAARRNINITYLVLNNQNYGLTTGQASPTTPLEAKTKTTPDGNNIEPLNPLDLAKVANAKFAKQVDGKDLLEMTKQIKEAILFDGFSFIDIQQDCPSFKKWS